MRAYVPRAFVSFLILETDNRTVIIDVLGAQISSTVLTSGKSSTADRSLCVEANNDEDAEEKLKPARRSRNPAKPADAKFSEAKHASDDDESDAAKYSCI